MIRKFLAVFAFYLIAFVALTSSSAQAQLSKPGQSGCEKCGAGEYRQRVEDIIPGGPDYLRTDNPPCGDGIALTSAIADAVSTGVRASAGQYDASAIAGSLGKVSDALKIGGTIGGILGGARQQHAACKPVCVIVPANATVTATHFEITLLERNAPGQMEVVNPSAPHFDYGRVDFPVSKPGAVCTTVANWAQGIERRFIMDAYFTSPQPPIEIR